jgi:hypothetical protein
MAKFNGTVQEFHHFIGPRLRNAINNYTKRHRNERHGICEFCLQEAELQSAHVHGRDRRSLIESVLSGHTDKDSGVSCDIGQIESEILAAHEPIGDTFKFICRPCHVTYDAPAQDDPANNRTEREPPVPEFTKIGRIRLWAKRPHQTNHMMIRAFLELRNNGEVTRNRFRQYFTEAYGIEGFDGHYASMKTDAGNSHGAVFYESGGIVKIWDRVYAEIQEHFHECTL